MKELQNKLKQEQVESHYHQGNSTNTNSFKTLGKLNILIILMLALGVIFIFAPNLKNDDTAEIEKFWKYFWKASAYSAQKNYKQMNANLNKMANSPCCNSNRLNRALGKADEFCSNLSVGITARIVLLENKKIKTAIDNMVKIKEENPKQWEKFINSQNLEQTNHSEKKTKEVAVTKSNT